MRRALLLASLLALAACCDRPGTGKEPLECTGYDDFTVTGP